MAELQRPITTAAQRQGNRSFVVAIAVSQACALLRYVVLARMLGPHELGLAVMIVLVGQFFDSVTDSGSDRFLIQHPDGAEPRSQALVQLVLLGRGVIVALLLVLFARPIAIFLDVPSIEDGLRLLALVPLISGFVHLDLRRVQRDHDFRIEGRAMLFAELFSLTATATVAILTHSHVAIVFGLIVRMITLAVVSHLMASRRFSARYAPEHARDFMLFGLPLMINGLLLFFGSQGDRVVVGRLLGPEELGRYSAAMLLIFYPIMLVQRYITGTYLPQLTRANADRSVNADQLGGIVTILGALATLGFVIAAPIAMPLLFGGKFTQSLLVIALIGALNSARFIKLWPTNMLLAEGRSQAVLLTNVIRLAAFPMAIVGVMWNASLETIVLAFLAGELISILAGLWLSSGPLGVRFSSSGERIAVFAFSAFIAAVGGSAVQRQDWLWLAAAVAGAIALMALFWWRERGASRSLLGIVFRKLSAPGSNG